ncbi:MAG: hypothetical protein ABIT36_08900 [Steroidobacteraceae bacterium]
MNFEQLDKHRTAAAVKLRAALNTSIAVGAILLGFAGYAHADARTQAKRMHDRIAGVPPDAATLNAMAALIPGDPIAAAAIALQAPSFYNVTLKNFVTPWTNRDQTVFAPLNDYTATVIGMIRDDVPFNTVLSADLLYVGGAGRPAYSPANNDLYEQLESSGADLSNPAVLVSTAQSTASGLPAAATAGVMSTRAAAQSFFVAGTNRAMFRFTLINHMCKDMEQVADTSRPPDRIRQDVSRSPGGDSRIFLNNCIGCHSGMDPMAQAFAYYSYDETAGRLVYTPGAVQPKYTINSDNFKPGFVTPDDHWDNYWRKGPNQLLGWSPTGGSGTGAKSLGQELAGSDQFARCQVEKVFKAVCFRAPGNGTDRTQVTNITTAFKSGGYKMKQVFAAAAAYCMGD